jgi:hypothetical protein
MQHEYNSLLDNITWELVDLPADRVVVNSMWIYKIKSDMEDAVSRFKVCLLPRVAVNARVSTAM